MRTAPPHLILLLPALIAGCDFGVTGTGSGGNGPTANQLSELARSFTDDLESETGTLTFTRPGAPVGIDFAGSCPTASNSDDDDADGIPDDATLTYSGAACEQATWRGGAIAVTGAVRVQDLSQSNDYSYELTFDDLAWSYTNATETLSYTAVRHGRRLRAGDSDSIVVQTVDTTDRSRPVINAIAHIYKDLTWSFGADDDDAIAANTPLPNGRLAVEGDWSWNRATEGWDLAVTTPVRLQYDATCASPQRFTAGTIWLTGTIAGGDGRVELRFTGCGIEPTRSFGRFAD